MKTAQQGADAKRGDDRAIAPPSLPPFEFPRRQTRAEKQAETRSRILESANWVFQARGYHPATLEEIADVAGFTKGAVYSNFSSKDELFLALLDKVVDRRISDTQALFRGAKDVRSAMQKCKKYWDDVLDAERPWSHVEYEFVLHSLRYPELADRLRANHERFRRNYENLFRKVLKETDRDIGSVETLVTAVMVVARGVTLTNLQDPARYRSDMYALLMDRLFRTG